MSKTITAAEPRRVRVGKPYTQQWAAICMAFAIVSLAGGSVALAQSATQASGPQIRVNTEAPPARASDDAGALAEKLQNPIADLISVPFQNNSNFNVGPHNGVQDMLNIPTSLQRVCRRSVLARPRSQRSFRPRRPSMAGPGVQAPSLDYRQSPASISVPTFGVPVQRSSRCERPIHGSMGFWSTTCSRLEAPPVVAVPATA